MKRAIAIMGSPRKNKNTNDLLDIFIQGLDKNKYDIKKIYLRDKKLENCTSCYYCGENIDCAINDDMNEIYNDLESELIIFAAPLYFNSINGLSKTVVDRSQRYWSEKYIVGKRDSKVDKKGIFLSVGGAPFSYNQFYGAITVMDYFFKAINTKYLGNYLVSNTDKEPINKQLLIKDELESIARNIDNQKKFLIQR